MLASSRARTRTSRSTARVSAAAVRGEKLPEYAFGCGGRSGCSQRTSVPEGTSRIELDFPRLKSGVYPANWPIRGLLAARRAGPNYPTVRSSSTCCTWGTDFASFSTSRFSDSVRTLPVIISSPFFDVAVMVLPGRARV